MRALQTLKPLLQALAATALGVLAFGTFMQAGAGLETGLFAALVAAGALNVAATASLNAEAFHPTSGLPVGDCQP